MSEISGILKNGIDRGWQLEEIKKSLLNAGYLQKEIDSEMSAFQAQPPVFTQSIEKEKFDSQKLSNYQSPAISQNKKPFPILMFMIILLLIILGAGIGLYFWLF